MILESLLELVETLNTRIDEHVHEFQRSEALTRYALINPLLRELGWNTEDPDVVRPEYYVPNKQLADYVLFTNGEPTIVVESKRLDEPLRGGRALDQGILNSAHLKAKYFLLTDGRRWELYESGETTAIISFDLKGSSSAEVCLNALALWRPSIQSHHIAVAHKSVITPPEIPKNDEGISDSPPPSKNDDHEWVPLTKVIGKGNIGTEGMKPVELEFPDNKRVPLQFWYELMTEPTLWLLDNSHLDPSTFPIRRSGDPNNKDNAVATTPYHPDERPMKSRELSPGVYVATNYNPDNSVRNAIAIVKHAHQDPLNFRVRIVPRA